MTMRVILMYLWLACPLVLSGQHPECGLDHRYTLNASNPKYVEFLDKVSRVAPGGMVLPRSIRYIPVVIHVVATEAYQPISRAQVLQQLDVLNADFAGEGENRHKLLSEFEPIASGVTIRFCLANVDPNGQPTEGITYTHTDIPNIALQSGEGGRIAIHYDQLGGKTGWPPDTYLNIWVGEYGDFLGSATFPGMAPYPEEIGVVVDIRHFGAIGDVATSGFYGRGHTLTHELGHFFGLKHTWGQGLDYYCDDSDDIDDTPNAAGPYYDCPSGVQRSCDTDNMYQNFMDFTDDRCLAAFTAGQAAHMEAALEAYYPLLFSEEGCASVASSFDTWYKDLKWSYDAFGKNVVIYSDSLLPAAKEVRVFSADGKLVHQGTWENSSSYLIKMDRVGIGVYFIQISEGTHVEVYKLPVY